MEPEIPMPIGNLCKGDIFRDRKRNKDRFFIVAHVDLGEGTRRVYVDMLSGDSEEFEVGHEINWVSSRAVPSDFVD